MLEKGELYLVRKIILSTLLLILILGTTSLASGTWDLSEYKDVYKMIASKTDSSFIYFSVDDISTDNLFTLVTDALNSSNYNQSNYSNALCYVNFSSSNITFNFINSTTTNPLEVLRPYGTLIVNVSKSGNNLGTTEVYTVTVDNATYNGRINYTQNTYPRIWNITKQNSNYINQNENSFNAYRGADLGILGEDSFENLYVGAENNYIINSDFVIGNSYQLQNYDFYYIENGEKISVKENIQSKVETYWWGRTYTFYILEDNISLFPNYTNFYVSLEALAKSSYNKTFQIEKKAFRTSNTGSSIGGEPENPEEDNTTGNITNPSGETTGNVDLSGIQTGITDINNNIGETNNKLDNISGELSNINNNLTNVPDISDTTITNEDITNNLDFEFMEDPYANFWFELTTGLSGALTNNVRTLDINWLGHIHTINLDNIGLKYPPSMELILKSTSTVAIVWVLVKWWKIIVDKLSSGNMDEVLAMNEEERNY